MDLIRNAPPKPLKGEYTAERKRKEREHKAREQRIMDAVKSEDGLKCRVPLCKTGLRAECCHEVHRGIGGNPDEDRTVPSRLITLCVTHHDLYDRGRLDIRCLTAQRLRGACDYYLDGQFIGGERIERVSETRTA